MRAFRNFSNWSLKTGNTTAKAGICNHLRYRVLPCEDKALQLHKQRRKREKKKREERRTKDETKNLWWISGGPGQRKHRTALVPEDLLIS